MYPELSLAKLLAMFQRGRSSTESWDWEPQPSGGLLLLLPLLLGFCHHLLSHLGRF